MRGPTGSDVSPRPADQRLQWLLLGLVFFGLYAFATLTRRGATWGLHSLAYFPPPIRIAGLAVCLGLLFRPVQERAVTALRAALQPLLKPSLRGGLFLVPLGLLGFLVFYSFPIRTTVYGDSRTILHWYADNTQLPSGWFAHIFDLHLLASKETLTVLLHRTVAHVFSISIGQAYRILSAMAGALSLCLWFHFLRRQASSSRWGPLLLILGCVLGSDQIFFGHVEDYPFAFLTSLAFLLMGSLMLQGEASFWTVALLFIFAVKAHAVTIYLLPALLVLVAWRLSQRFPSLRSLLTWRRLAVLLVAPSLVAGACLYFFYFKSYNEPHSSLSAFRQIFLPIIPPPPPMQYSLQSIDHLLDLGNVMLLVGAPAIVCLLGLILIHRRHIDWQHPRVVFATLAFAYPLLFFFALNPALSMPRDWDVYSLLGGPLLLFLATVLAHGDERVPSAPIHGTALAFGVFSVGFFALNTSPTPLSLRLEDVGEHVFRTYHSNSSYMIASAQGMEGDSTRVLARRIATVERLAPAVVGEDAEYVHLLVIIASTYRQLGDRTQAVSWMERAARTASHDPNLALWLSDYYLWAGQAQAAQHCIDILLSSYPRNLDALIQGALAASKQRDFDGALAYLERARAVAPRDRDVAAWIEQVKKRQAQRRSGA